MSKVSLPHLITHFVLNSDHPFCFKFRSTFNECYICCTMVYMTNKSRWSDVSIDSEDIELLADKLNISNLISKILLNAGFTQSAPQDVERFLNPKMDEIMNYDGVSSPTHIRQSIHRIKAAIKKNETVFVNGDPDADGISGATILTAALRHFGLNTQYFFPIRSKEGHGLQIRIIQAAVKAGCSLIVTTDCGTKDVEAVEYANEQGVDVIITDHHILGDTLPNATAIINPYLNTDPEHVENQYLSGSYVAFKWVMALKDALHKKFPKDIFECLVICASLGAISDRISLKKPMNRAIIKLGIDYLNNTTLAGIKALKEISIPKRHTSLLRAREISRTIAPRMNAPGRIGDPELNIPDSSAVVDLLLAGLSIGPRSNIKQFIDKYKQILQQEKIMKQQLDITDQVEIVDGINSKRKKMTEDIELNIETQLQTLDINEERLLIIKGDNWNSGVIGIDADRLRDRFGIPVIIMTTVENSEFVKGSIRSLKTINMYKVMEQAQQTFESTFNRNPYQANVPTPFGDRLVNAFGGHAQACGFTIHQSDIPEWEKMVRSIVETIPDAQFKLSIPVIKTLHFYDINPRLLSELDTLSPYGEGFDYPIFRLKRIQFDKNAKPFGNMYNSELTPHVELKIMAPTKNKRGKRPFIRATGYSLWDHYQSIVLQSSESHFDIVFTVDHPYRNKGKRLFPELQLLDIKPASHR